MLDLKTAKILVITPNDDSKAYLEDFFDRIEGLKQPTYAINKLVSTDKFDFLIFDARTLGPLPNIAAVNAMPEAERQFLFLLDRYLSASSKNILWFGPYLFSLNQERCPSANSKFTLFARIREMLDYLNHFRLA